MDFIKAMTPKNTEEVKPGLFIQARPSRREGIIYRQVHPAAWNGKLNWYNFLLGPNFFKNSVWIIIILFIAWSYSHDVEAYQNYYEELNSNFTIRQEFCSGSNFPLEEFSGEININRGVGGGIS